jgi:hypothetical protein
MRVIGKTSIWADNDRVDFVREWKHELKNLDDDFTKDKLTLILIEHRF